MPAFSFALLLTALNQQSPRCVAPKAQAAKVEAFRADATSSPLYLFAVKNFGAPLRCRGTSHKSADGQSNRLTFDFAGGTTLILAVSMPETIEETLTGKPGFVDLAQAKAAMDAEAKNSNGHIDWTKKPEESAGSEPGSVSKTYWDPSDDSNLGVDLVYRGPDLVGLRFHLAL